MSNIQNTWHHIRRSPFQSLTAIFLMIQIFFLINSFLIVSLGFSNVLKYFETKPEITIFLKDGLEKSIVENIQKELVGYPDVKEVKFTSKEKALSIYKEQNKDNPLLTEMVTSSVLPASFEVSVQNAAALETIYQNFNTKKDVISDIIYQKNIIDQLLVWTRAIRNTGIILISIFTITSAMVMSIVIGMKITNRKEQINISRLLGASHFYVKKPFLYEGLFYGIFGSIIGFSASFILFFVYKNNINTFFDPIIFMETSFNIYFMFLLIEIILGSIIGYISSWLGVKRYIKF
jgi:cell division transport system permease protein